MKRLLVVMFLSLGACETTSHSCSLIGCESGLQVDFQTVGWATGQYRVDVTSGGTTNSCTVPIPLPADPTLCTGMRLNTVGSALPVGQQSLGGVHVDGVPSPVTIEVTRDGKSLAKQTFQPSYSTSKPNGPTCEPTCTQAKVTLSW